MFHFTVVSPRGVTYQDSVEKVSVPTESGEIMILPDHAPLISVLDAGELAVTKSGYTVGLAVFGGVVEVRQNGDVYVLADTAERAEHIDIEAAEAARKRAEELLAEQQTMEDVDFARIQAMLEKEMTRITIARKYRR